ncbi:MAG: phospho-sugar mutase [SAR324 cluster bacterium]|nr:phospho-sugar mutase [SAR324 cluster bacterium]
MKSSIDKMARYWANSVTFDQSTRAEVQKLLDGCNEEELIERFISPLEFGTGGMRGIMGAGINRMNRYTVRQATEGLARYIRENPSDSHAGVVIGYDSRHHSFLFAQSAAEVLAGHGIPVYLFKKLAPTPLISFEVLRQKAIAGIVITASHNPPEYNGYKVYWKNGGQIIPPEDQEIIQQVRGVADMGDISSMDFGQALKEGKIQWLTEESDAAYLNALDELALGSLEQNEKAGIIYSPLHGTGVRSVPSMLQKRGFKKFTLVAEQAEPDGNFPTVTSPNPEDPGVFEKSIALAGPDDCLIMANDPDADRLGVMVRHDKEWHRLNGNQVGVLLLDDYLKKLQASGRLPKDGALVLTNVTSPLGKKVAQAYGLQVVETLTGFKWIWAAASKMENEGTGTFVFGMEESLGYLVGHNVGDKDGVWAAMAFAELTAALQAKGQTPLDQLHVLYQQFGYHLDDLETQTLPGVEGKEKIAAMMTEFRQNPPQQIGGKRLQQIIDFQENVVITPGSSTAKPGPGLPRSNVLTFYLEDDCRVVVRPSGTEPKIKYYFNLQGANAEEVAESLQKIKKDLLI